jgi:hypothetical protein
MQRGTNFQLIHSKKKLLVGQFQNSLLVELFEKNKICMTERLSEGDTKKGDEREREKRERRENHLKRCYLGAWLPSPCILI